MCPLVSKNLQIISMLHYLQVLIEEKCRFFTIATFYMHVRPESNDETSMFMLSQQT